MFDLLYAAAIGDLPSVRHCVLRSKKSSFLWGDLTRTCCRGRAAIQYAVLGGHADVTAELIEAGAQVDWQDKDGITCLMMVAERGNKGLLELLLRNGADIHITARDGANAAHFAAKHARMECLQRLLEAGSSVIATDCLGRMLLHWAAQHGHVKMAEVLLDQGCPVNGGNCHVTGETPLHTAVKYGRVDTVKLLLKNRACINTVTKVGSTPLHICCSSDLATTAALQEIGAMLLSQKKLHVQAVDSFGKSALSYTKDLTLKGIILSTLQGHPPTPPEHSQSRPAEGSAVQRHVVASPVTTCPHPLIPGHKWAEQGQFVLDSSDSKEHGTDYRARHLSHEELIWEATTSHGRPLKLSTYSGLIPSDCMWFDSGSQRILEVFPARQHLGRYSS